VKRLKSKFNIEICVECAVISVFMIIYILALAPLL